MKPLPDASFQSPTQEAIPGGARSDDSPGRAGGWLSFAFLAFTFAGLAFLSWGRWPDVLVDFGHELYGPWQLSEGKALLRDFAWGATGPLSPYLNALLFRVFGVSLRVLVFFNLGLLAVLTTVLHTILRALFDRLAAAAGCFTFLTIFAFAQYVEIGNYNYVTPYSHGATHGVLLSLFSILLVYRHLRTRSWSSLLGAGFLLGLVFLTKPEMFVACTAAIGIPLLIAPGRGGGILGRLASGMAFLAMAAVPSLAAFLLLRISLEPAVAWQATTMPWQLLLNPSGLAGNPFYLRGSGLDAPATNLLLLAKWLGGACVALLPVAVLDRFAKRWAPGRWVSLAVFLAVFSILVFAVPPDFWVGGIGRPLPVLALGGIVAYALLLLRDRDGGASGSRYWLGLMMSIFSLVLLSKILLNARTYHYGFVLAMPATVMLVGWLTFSLPSWIRNQGGMGVIFRGAALAMILAVVLGHLQASADRLGQKVYPVGSGADAFLADERGVFVSEAIRRLASIAPPGATLAVLPEGVMINYLSRRVNPTRYLAYLADAISMFGSDAPLVESLKSKPPDFILLVQRDSSEHGARFFGRDYARNAAAWIADNYSVISVIGAMPFEQEDYGMALLAHK
jgi:hypothetical protein